VPRPKCIADLHEAKYELRFCADLEKARKAERYKAALAAAVAASNLTGPQLEAAVARDFWDWVRQERLPKLPRKG
jgi:hypothetical protein